MLGAHRLPAGYRMLYAPALPQTHRAPQPPARRRPAAPYGVEAPIGMALAIGLDSAKMPHCLQWGRMASLLGV